MPTSLLENIHSRHSSSLYLEEHDRLLPVSGGAPGGGVQSVKHPLFLLDVAAAELDGEVDTDPVDVARISRLKEREREREREGREKESIRQN